MDIIAPTNWDAGLVAEYKKSGVKEVYAKMAIDFIGGGRPAYILPSITRKHAEEHIHLFRDAGIKFNYILNAPSLNSQEFTRSGKTHINRLLKWLTKAGVDKVTVTIPYLLQFVKKEHPSLKTCVSVFAGVDSVNKALFWQGLGADEITLLQTSLNRNFNQLKLIRKNVKLRLKLIGNTGCLYQCPLIGYHALISSHASQRQHSHRAGLMYDYCSLFCRYLRLDEPVKFIRSNWIRPEDLHIYEGIGIDGIKLVDRSCSTEQLIKIVSSYSKRYFEGNLLELLPLFYGRSRSIRKGLLLKIRYLFHPFENDIFSLPKLNVLVQDLEIQINNRELDGFIDKFLEKDCSTIDCLDCQYCDQVAEKVVRYDKLYVDTLKDKYKEFLDKL